MIQNRSDYLWDLEHKVFASVGEPQAAESAKMAQQIGISLVDIITLSICFIVGGFTSAVWGWRMALVAGVRPPTWAETFSSFFVSGIVATGLTLLMKYFWNAPLFPAIAISIMAGFGGDSFARLLLVLFKKLVVDTFYRLFNINPKENDPKKPARRTEED